MPRARGAWPVGAEYCEMLFDGREGGDALSLERNLRARRTTVSKFEATRRVQIEGMEMLQVGKASANFVPADATDYLTTLYGCLLDLSCQWLCSSSKSSKSMGRGWGGR